MKQVKLFIVDDHYMVIEGIRTLLADDHQIEWCGHATNANSCMAFLQHQQPDVILMDINLPDKSGIDLCKEVKAHHPGICVLGLSTFNQQSYIQKMMDSGASGYVLKNATHDELMEAINTVLKGRLYFADEVLKVLRTEHKEGILLTRREREILRLIAEGYTNQEIATNLFISISTVDTHRKNLLVKLKAKNTAQLVHIAAQMNLL